MAKSFKITVEPAPGVSITTIASDRVTRVISTTDTALGQSREHLVASASGTSDHQLFWGADDSFRFVQHVSSRGEHNLLVKVAFDGPGSPDVTVISSNNHVGNVIHHTDLITDHQTTHYDVSPDLLWM